MTLNENPAGQRSKEREQPAIVMRAQMPTPLITAKL